MTDWHNMQINNSARHIQIRIPSSLTNSLPNVQSNVIKAVTEDPTTLHTTNPLALQISLRGRPGTRHAFYEECTVREVPKILVDVVLSDKPGPRPVQTLFAIGLDTSDAREKQTSGLGCFLSTVPARMVRTNDPVNGPLEHSHFLEAGFVKCPRADGAVDRVVLAARETGLRKLANGNDLQDWTYLFMRNSRGDSLFSLGRTAGVFFETFF